MGDEWMTTPLATVPEHWIPREETAKRGRPRNDDPTRRKYGLSEVKDMLAVIPADDRDLWLNVGIILGRAFNRCDEAWGIYNEWADKWDGQKDRNHDKHMRHFFYDKSQEGADRELSIGTIVKLAREHGWVPSTGRIPLDDFYFHIGNGFLYRPTMEICSAKDVDIAVSPRMDDGVVRKASEIIQQRRLVTSVTSHPQLEEYTPEMNMVKGELVTDTGAAILNLYRHATIPLGEAALAKPWIEHCRKLFNKPGDCDQFFDFIAHRVQKPWEKIRFALLIGGGQGVGKDTAIEMCVPTIGAWNVENIPPRALKTDFNAYLVCALLRVNEAADAQDQSRWMLNEQLKNIIAGTPDHATINGKYQVTQHIRLYCAVIVTTNHLLASIHIPPDDRRFDVIECASMEEMELRPSDKEKAEVTKGLNEEQAQAALTALEEQYAKERRTYFEDLWGWFYEQRGAQHIAAFLHERPLSGFSAALGQRKTAAHADVVRSGMITDEWLVDVLEDFTNTDLVSGRVILRIMSARVTSTSTTNYKGKLPFAMERLGYVVFANPTTKEGRWRLKKSDGTDNGWHTVYRKRTFPVEDIKEGWQETMDH